MLKSNKKPFLLLSLLAFSLLIYNCSKEKIEDDTPIMMNPTPLDIVPNITIADIGNAGNGTDLQISFTKISDETNVKEYQVFVVNSGESSSFDQDKAEIVAASNLTTVAKTGSNISITLTAEAKTVLGALIDNDIPYKVFVLTVSSDPTLFLNALSTPSVEFTLDKGDKVKVTYIANDGVMIDFQGKKVVIDAINRLDNLGGWISPSSAALLAIENGDPPYDDIDVIMITHNHGDHYSTTAVRNYLSKHPNTKLIVPSGIKASFNSFSNRIVDFEINKFGRVNVVENDISIDVLQVEHFDQFGNNFSGTESYAYLVELNGKKFLHTGDLDYTDSRLGDFNLLADSVTVAFIPTFGNLVSATNRDSLITNVAPKQVIGLHFQSNRISTIRNQVNSVYTDADVFTVPFETRKY